MSTEILQKYRKQDYFIFLIILLLVFIMAVRTPVDSDLFWHLKAGEITLSTGKPLLTDVLSFTRYGAGWINHSWLGQVFWFLGYKGLGYLGVSLLVGLSAAAMVGLVYLQMRGHPIFRAFVIILGCLVLAPVWSPRPQLFSLIFLAGLNLLLHRYRERKTKRIWLMPLLFLVWSNLHGGYILGFMLLGGWLAGEILDRFFNPENEPLSWKELGKLILWAAVSVPALVINPNGLNMLAIPFQTIGVTALQRTIEEWASPDFHQLYAQPFLWLFFAVVISFALVGKKVKGTDLVLVLVFAFGGFTAQRNIGPFAIIAMPVLSRYLWEIMTRFRLFKKRGQEMEQSADDEGFPRIYRKQWQRRINLILVLLLGLVAAFKLIWVSSPALVEEVIAGGYPTQAVTILQNEHFEGELFNEYNWGGYLTFTLPDHKVYVDGRTDLFGDEILLEWETVVKGEEGWQQIMEKWNVHLAMLQPDRRVVRLLDENGWQLLYGDDLEVLYYKPTDDR